MVPGRDFYFSFSVSNKNILRSHWQFFPENSENREDDFSISNLDLTFGKHPALFAPAHLLEEKDPGVSSAKRKTAWISTPLA